MKILEEIIETSAKVADQVAKVAGECIDKGKGKISELSLENELAKAQKQLGALVYAFHKTGEQNDELLNQYIEDVARIDLQLSIVKSSATEKEQGNNTQEQDCNCQEEVTKPCLQCGEKIGCCDVFCRNCGLKVDQ